MTASSREHLRARPSRGRASHGTTTIEWHPESARSGDPSLSERDWARKTVKCRLNRSIPQHHLSTPASRLQNLTPRRKDSGCAAAFCPNRHLLLGFGLPSHVVPYPERSTGGGTLDVFCRCESSAASPNPAINGTGSVPGRKNRAPAHLQKKVE